MSELSQNLPKIGPYHSSIHEKQMHIVELIKKGEVKLELRCDINQNIPGLRKKKHVGAMSAASQWWWKPFHSYERNGAMHWVTARNWARFVWPFIPLWFCFYIAIPMLHGNIYI